MSLKHNVDTTAKELLQSVTVNVLIITKTKVLHKHINNAININ